MAKTKNYHINLEVEGLANKLLINGYSVEKKISRRDVPYLLVYKSWDTKISACFFWSTKMWKVWKWDSANTFLGKRDCENIQEYIQDLLKSDK